MKYFYLVLIIFISSSIFATTSSITYKVSFIDDKNTSTAVGDYLLRVDLANKIYDGLSTSAKNILTTNLILEKEFESIVSAMLTTKVGSFYDSKYSNSLNYNFNQNQLLGKIIKIQEDDRKIILAINASNEKILSRVMNLNRQYLDKNPSYEALNQYKSLVSKLNSNYLLSSAVTHFALENYSKSKAILASNEINKNNSLLHIRNIYAGRIFLKDGNFPSAKKYLEEAYKENDEFSVSNFYYGEYWAIVDKDKSYKYFKKMDDLEPKLENLLYKSAVHLEDESRSQSIKIMEQAIKIKKTAENLYWYADKKGIEDEDYMKILENSISLKPNYYKSYAGMAKWYDAKNDMKNAIYNMRVAYSINPKDVNVIIDLGNYYSKINNMKMALLYYQQALLIDEDNKKLLEILK